MAYEYKELKESRRSEYTKDGIVQSRVYVVKDTNLAKGELIDAELVLLNAKNKSEFRLGADHPVIPKIYVSSVSSEQTPNLEHAKLTVEYEPGARAEGFNDDGELWEFEIATTKVTVMDTNGLRYENIGVGGRTDLIGSAIGVKEDGSIGGAEVYRPTWSMRCTKIFKSFSPSTLRDMFATARFNAWQLTATLNNEMWMGFPTASVLFLGANISKKSAIEWQFEYNFSVAPPAIVEDIELSDGRMCGFTGYISGHHIIDITHDVKIVDGEKRMGIYNVGIRQVYPLKDFSLLGLTGAGIV